MCRLLLHHRCRPPTPINFPKVKVAPPGSDICIRNHLVKQAARAYVSPMSEYPTFAGGNFFHFLWTGVAAFIHLFCTKYVRSSMGRSELSGSAMCFLIP